MIYHYDSMKYATKIYEIEKAYMIPNQKVARECASYSDDPCLCRDKKIRGSFLFCHMCMV